MLNDYLLYYNSCCNTATPIDMSLVTKMPRLALAVLLQNIIYDIEDSIKFKSDAYNVSDEALTQLRNDLCREKYKLIRGEY